MKNLAIAAALLISLGTSAAWSDHGRDRGHHVKPYDRQAWGRVVEVSPVIEARYVTRRDDVCGPVTRRAADSHTPVVLGAVIGAALGHAIGDAHGDPKAAAVAGGLLGATVGSDAARRSGTVYATESCHIEERTERLDEVVGYQVTYRYMGQLYSTRMNRDPGDWVKLRVDVQPL